MYVLLHTGITCVCTHTYKHTCSLCLLQGAKQKGTSRDRKVKQDTWSQKCFIMNSASLVRPRPNPSVPGLRSTSYLPQLFTGCKTALESCQCLLLPWHKAGAHGRKQLSTAYTAPTLLPSQTTPALLSSMSLLLGQNLFQHIQTVGLTGLLK